MMVCNTDVDALMDEVSGWIAPGRLLPAGDFYELVSRSVEQGNQSILNHLAVKNQVSVAFLPQHALGCASQEDTFHPGRIKLPRRARIGRRVISLTNNAGPQASLGMSIREKLPITIEIDLVYRDDMRALGAILAHEDTHLLLWLLGCRQTQGDRDEIRTDIAAIMLGLGDLLSNGRDRYRGNGRMESMGYLDSESVRYVQARMLQLQSKVVKGVVKMGRIKCQSCGSENNQDGDVFCGDCGTKMVAPQPVQPPPAVVQPLPPVVMPAPPQPVMQPAAPVAQPLSPVMQPPALSPAVVAKAKLVVKSTGRVGHEFPIHQEAVNIGRWDSDSGTFPEVDLTQDDAANVISRRHAKITVENGEFFLEDVGSVNGTYVNRGPRLMPGARQKLQNGDEVVMGRTFFTFVIE